MTKTLILRHVERREKSYTRDINANAQPLCIVRLAGRIRFLSRFSFQNDVSIYLCC